MTTDDTPSTPDSTQLNTANSEILRLYVNGSRRKAFKAILVRLTEMEARIERLEPTGRLESTVREIPTGAVTDRTTDRPSVCPSICPTCGEQYNDHGACACDHEDFGDGELCKHGEVLGLCAVDGCRGNRDYCPTGDGDVCDHCGRELAIGSTCACEPALSEKADLLRIGDADDDDAAVVLGEVDGPTTCLDCGGERCVGGACPDCGAGR